MTGRKHEHTDITAALGADPMTPDELIEKLNTDCADLLAALRDRDARIAAALALCAEATSTEPYGGTKWTDDPYDAGLPLFVKAMADTLAGRPVTDTP